MTYVITANQLTAVRADPSVVRQQHFDARREGIFSWPGMGNLAFTAAINRDYPMVLAILLVVGSASVLLNLVADVLYAVVDPRIRY